MEQVTKSFSLLQYSADDVYKGKQFPQLTIICTIKNVGTDHKISLNFTTTISAHNECLVVATKVITFNTQIIFMYVIMCN